MNEIAEKIVAVVNDSIAIDISRRTRRRDISHVRFSALAVLHSRGYTATSIASAFGYDRTSVKYGIEAAWRNKDLAELSELIDQWLDGRFIGEDRAMEIVSDLKSVSYRGDGVIRRARGGLWQA